MELKVFQYLRFGFAKGSQSYLIGIESVKVAAQLLHPPALNRTLLELKVLRTGQNQLPVVALNRTLLELKELTAERHKNLQHSQSYLIGIESDELIFMLVSSQTLNRTLLELKDYFRMRVFA